MTDKNYGQLDEKALIFRQIDRTNRLVTQSLEDLETVSWDVFVERFGLAVRNLESLLSPLIDGQYRKEKEKLKERVRERIKMEAGEEMGRSEFIFEKKDYYNALLSKLIQLLYRNSVYFGESEEFVIDKTKEKEDEAVVVD